MKTLIIIFIIAVLVIGLFCAAVVCRDIIVEALEKRPSRKEKKAKKKASAQTDDCEPLSSAANERE